MATSTFAQLLSSEWMLWPILGLYIIRLKHEWTLQLILGLYIIRLNLNHAVVGFWPLYYQVEIWVDTVVDSWPLYYQVQTHIHTHMHTLTHIHFPPPLCLNLSNLASLSLSYLNNTHSGQGMPWGTPWQCLRGCWRRLCTNSECTEWWPLQTSTAGCCSGWRHCGSSETARRPKTDHIKIFMEMIQTIMAHQRNGSYAPTPPSPTPPKILLWIQPGNDNNITLVSTSKCKHNNTCIEQYLPTLNNIYLHWPFEMNECQTACFAAMGPLHNDQSHNTVEPLNKQATGTIKKQLPLNHFSTKVSTLLVLSLTPPSAPPPPPSPLPCLLCPFPRRIG